MNVEVFVGGLTVCVLGGYIVGVCLAGPESEIARLLLTFAGLGVTGAGMILVLVAVA